MNLLKGAYTYLAGKIEDVSGKRKERYVEGFFHSQQPVKKDGYFDKGLEVAVAFRSAKKYRKPEYMQAALSAFESLKAEFSDKNDAGSIATDIWMNIEAYQATGEDDYVRAAKKDAEALVKMMRDFTFVKHTGDASVVNAEDQLMAASALLQLYELYPKAEKYREKAEGILKFFADRHAKDDGKIVERLKVKINEKTLETIYEPDGAACGKPRYLGNLAAIAYLNAQRVTNKYADEAKKFFELSDKSVLIYSEARAAFKTGEYAGAYKELLKREMRAPNHSAGNLAGVVGAPAFEVESLDPKLYRDMLCTSLVATIGMGFMGSVAPFYATALGLSATAYGASVAASFLASTLALPYIGRLADRIGRKTMLAAGLAAYSASVLLTPWAMENYGELGLYASQVARAVAGSAPGPIISSLVTDGVPPSKKTEGLSWSTGMQSLGYAGGSLFTGPGYEYMNAASGVEKYLPFAAAAIFPIAMAAQTYASYKNNKLRRERLEAIFKEPS